MRTWNDLRVKSILKPPSPLPKCAGIMWSDVIDRFYDQSSLASACHRADEKRYSGQETSREDCGFISKRGLCDKLSHSLYLNADTVASTLGRANHTRETECTTYPFADKVCVANIGVET